MGDLESNSGIVCLSRFGSLYLSPELMILWAVCVLVVPCPSMEYFCVSMCFSCSPRLLILSLFSRNSLNLLIMTVL